MVVISSRTPSTMKVRILRSVYMGDGKEALEGDVWEVSRYDADTLISGDSAIRVIDPDEIVIQPTEREIIARSDSDPAPKLISKSELKPRPRMRIPPNLLIGHVLPSK